MSSTEERTARRIAILKSVHDYAKDFNTHVSVTADVEDMRANGGTYDEPYCMFADGGPYLDVQDDHGLRTDFLNGKNGEYDVDRERIVNYDLPPLPKKEEP